jgi:predicted small lipoprotein YifL
MHCWARYLLILVVVALGALSMIGACGRKGPLYLPEEPAQKATAAQSEVPQTPAIGPAPEPARP